MIRSAATRRQFLQTSATGLAALGLLRNAFAASSEKKIGKAKRCIVLWMNGGPSQFETFDPKEGTNGGPTGRIPTKTPGIHISANLPKLAQFSESLAILRNVTSPEGDHERAQYYLHTGFRLVPAFPRPTFGAVVSHERPDRDAPKFVLLGQRAYGPAYCGPDHGAFAIRNAEEARTLMTRIRRKQDDVKFLQQLNQPFDDRNRFPSLARRSAIVSRIERMVDTPFRKALQLESESTETRSRYGDSEFGRRCLLARRLLENGTPFVEVQLDGWDTHVNNFASVTRLTQPLDSAFTALIQDLKSNGQYDDTLIVWMGEFGRTPLINGQNGRDHFPRVTPIVMSGGCLPTGQAIGATNGGGNQIEGAAYSVPDLAATIFQLVDVDLDKEFRTSFDSPTKPIEEGAQPIRELAS